MESQPKRTKTDLEQLSDLNRRFIENFVNNDVDSHNQIIHNDFVYISVAGKVIGRDNYMRAWATGYDKDVYKSFGYGDEDIRVFNDLALVRSVTSYSRTENGALVEGQNIYTDTYIKEDGRWWCVQAQITKVV